MDTHATGGAGPESWHGDRGPVDIGTATALGARAENQDRSRTWSGAAVVSDGVGGHAGGARAAELTVEAVARVLAGEVDGAGGAVVDEALLRRAVAAADRDVRAGQRRDPATPDMAATLVLAAGCAFGDGESRWLVANVGDSPAWVVSRAGARLVTVEHSLTGELLRSGALATADARRHPGRHVVTRVIGGGDEARPAVCEVTMVPGDLLVLASDGLSDVVDDAALHSATTDPGALAGGTAALAGGTAADMARDLVDVALLRGATDNVTVAVVHHLSSCAGDPDST